MSAHLSQEPSRRSRDRFDGTSFNVSATSFLGTTQNDPAGRITSWAAVEVKQRPRFSLRPPTTSGSILRRLIIHIILTSRTMRLALLGAPPMAPHCLNHCFLCCSSPSLPSSSLSIPYGLQHHSLASFLVQSNRSFHSFLNASESLTHTFFPSCPGRQSDRIDIRSKNSRCLPTTHSL